MSAILYYLPRCHCYGRQFKSRNKNSFATHHFPYILLCFLVSFLREKFAIIFKISRFFAKERLDFAFRTFLFGLCSASKIFIILSWLIYVHPVVPWHMQIEFLLGLVSIPILFYIVCTSDPGFINVTHKVQI